MQGVPEVGDHISVPGAVFPDGRPREGHLLSFIRCYRCFGGLAG